MNPTPERVPLAHVARRGAGKTHELLRWLSEGERIEAYPRWSRVLVVPDASAATRLTVDLPVDCPWRLCVWTVRDLQAAFRGPVRPGQVQYAVDDADLLLRQALGVHQGPARLALCAEVAALPHVTCHATHPILNEPGTLTCVDDAGHAPSWLHTDPTHGGWRDPTPDQESVELGPAWTPPRPAATVERLREAMTRARETLPPAIAAAVESAMNDASCEWEPGYHERLADEVLALAAHHAVEHGQLYAGGSVLVWPEAPELERHATLEQRVEASQRRGGRVLRRRVLVLEDWVELPGRVTPPWLQAEDDVSEADEVTEP